VTFAPRTSPKEVGFFFFASPLESLPEPLLDFAFLEPAFLEPDFLESASESLPLRALITFLGFNFGGEALREALRFFGFNFG